VSDLLTLDDIAALWKVERDYARRYLVKLPEFPEPAPGSTRKKARWRAEDVRRYLNGEEQPA
jgi:hypothetical protein